MSLLKLKNLNKSEDYYPVHTYPYGKRGYANNKYSPIYKTIKKCEILNFYTHIAPLFLGFALPKNAEIRYYYSELISCLLGLDKDNFRKSLVQRRIRTFLYNG